LLRIEPRKFRFVNLDSSILHVVNCVNCGILTERKFCSPKCSGSWGAQTWNKVRPRRPQVECACCGTLTKNPKFCSRSCSTSVANTANPKRKRTAGNTCKACRCSLPSGYTYCESCHEEHVPRLYNHTLAEIRGDGNANRCGRYPSIRQAARRRYIKSDKPMACLICGYSLHVDICHMHVTRSV
jgi:hypothetical protein